MNKIPLFAPFESRTEGLATLLNLAVEIEDSSLKAQIIVALGRLENTIIKSGTAGQS